MSAGCPLCGAPSIDDRIAHRGDCFVGRSGYVIPDPLTCTCGCGGPAIHSECHETIDELLRETVHLASKIAHLKEALLDIELDNCQCGCDDEVFDPKDYGPHHDRECGAYLREGLVSMSHIPAEKACSCALKDGLR